MYLYILRGHTWLYKMEIMCVCAHVHMCTLSVRDNN